MAPAARTIGCTRNPSSRACGIALPMRASIAAARLAHRSGIAEVERDPADIGFVDDVRRTDLERDREADRSGRSGGLVGIGGETRLRARDAVRVEHGLDFGRIEPGSAVRRARRRSRRGRPRGRARTGSGRAGGRLHQQRLVALIAHAVQKTRSPRPRAFHRSARRAALNSARAGAAECSPSQAVNTCGRAASRRAATRSRRSRRAPPLPEPPAPSGS